MLRSLGWHPLTLAKLWESEAERVVLQALADKEIPVLAERLGKPQILHNTLAAFASSQLLQASQVILIDNKSYHANVQRRDIW